MAAEIFTTDAARARLAGWYDRFLAKVPGPVERRHVPTAVGPTHVLLAGDPAGPPLVALHSMLTGSAHLVSELAPLLGRFRVVAPDIPGKSVHGPEVRLPVADESHARWLLEVLDGLGLPRADLLGVSWGGFVARQTATLAPARVGRLVLIVPAGIVRGAVLKGLLKMAVPALLYKLRPTDARLRRLVAPILTTWDDDWCRYTGDAFRDFRFDPRLPPLAPDDELRRLSAPTLVLAGEDDISFPGRELVARVRALVPGADAEVIPGSKHGPPTTPEFREWLADRVARFLTPAARP